MGDPKKRKKRYDTPRKPFEKERFDAEKKTVEEYGLKNKRELYKAETELKKKRATARKLLALELEQRLKREKELLDSLRAIGILSEKATLEDVLTLNVEALLERRLQTIVLRKGLATTPKQARQFITHGHIEINGKKTDRPGFIVKKENEGKIKYHGNEMMIEHKTIITKKKKEEENEIRKKFEEVESETKTEDKAIIKDENKTVEEKKRTIEKGRKKEVDE